jgi:Raf kinase inhibitor-like YbhB/YbcL family protein
VNKVIKTGITRIPAPHITKAVKVDGENGQENRVPQKGRSVAANQKHINAFERHPGEHARAYYASPHGAGQVIQLVLLKKVDNFKQEKAPQQKPHQPAALKVANFYCGYVHEWYGSSMRLTSPAFDHTGVIPPKYTCDGEDTNPPLRFEGVPTETKSLVLLMEDPDVPKQLRADGMWDHWIVFNILPVVKEIPEGEEPLGVHGTGTSNNTNYHGPCPPDREHRYFFKLFALDTTLELPPGATKPEVLQAMEGHMIDQAELMGRYERHQ